MENEEKTFTKLVDKQYSPLVIRKYTHWGFPIYVALISDNDLTDLDKLCTEFMKEEVESGSWVNNIQTLRNLAGKFVDHLNNFYDKTEGVAVVIYADKCFISSLHGDFMNHAACKQELMFFLNMSALV